MPRAVYRRATDGSGDEEIVWRLEHHAHLADWSPDGRTLVVEVQDPKTSSDIWRLDLEGKPTPTVFVRTAFNERSSRLSPDGRWLVYVSDESGRDEVYVQSFPDPGPRLQVSTGGGEQPVWSRDGRAIFFRGGGVMNEVPFQAGPRPAVGAPVTLFPDRFESPNRGSHTGYDVWPDGRFLMIESSESKDQRSGELSPRIVFVVNWFEELRSRVAADRR